MKMRYRLGLDIGTTSIGWCLLRLNPQDEPVALIKMGVRIFPDGRNPKDGSSLAVTRRNARAMRRRRDRLLKRKNRLMEALVKLDFFPEDMTARRELENLNPYLLRKKGLDEKLTPNEFARALFHINQRRGFKSNRKTDKGASDSGALKSAIKRVAEQLQSEGARTVGEWLANRHTHCDENGRPAPQSVRARLRGAGSKAVYDFYIDRAMIAAEFDTLWAKQAELQPSIFTNEKRDELRDILLHQRPLRPVKPGRCTLLPDEMRAPLALPSIQRFRILQELNHLRLLATDLTDNALTLDQRNTLFALLETKNDVTFTAIKKALGLGGIAKFNIEDAKRDKLKGNATTVMLSKPEHFGKTWFEFSAVMQDDIVMKLVNEQNESTLIEWLMTHTHVDELTAEKIANANLPEGYGNLSRLAAERIVPELAKAVITYDKAVLNAGFDHHSVLSLSQTTGEIMTALPYYGEVLQRHVGFAKDNPRNDEERFGKIANPTVHIGLNELRKVVNRLIERYGSPSEIIVEVARDLKNSKDKKDNIRKDQAERQKQNDDFRQKIKSLIHSEPNGLDIQKMRLWMELNPNDPANRRCPYTGEQISIEMLYSDAVEIEHILPFSKTLDDSLNNKTVSLRRANRDKGNQTPYEAFGHSPDGYKYEDMLERAKLMPKEKAKRFAVDGYERWLKEDKDFLARALTDTAYLSRIAKEYLSMICPHNKVRVIPGRLTAMLRGKFGLNALLSGTEEKNRNDHRHHAIDAAVIAVTDQGLLQRFASASAQARETHLNRLVKNMPFPWESYRDQVAAALNHIIVSFKPDHGYQGGLHNDTTYGLKPNGKVIHRIPLNSFNSGSDIEKAEFANPVLQAWLVEATQGLSGKEFKEKLSLITQNFRHRRVKVLEKLSVIPFSSAKATHRHGKQENGDPKAYKGYLGNSNYCIEITKSDSGKWEGEVVSTFQAYQIIKQLGEEAGLARLRHPTLSLQDKPLVMRLLIDDLVKMEIDGKIKTMRVCVIPRSGQMSFAEHQESNVDTRNRDKESPFAYITKYPGSLQKTKARRVTISPIGELRDPGFSG